MNEDARTHSRLAATASAKCSAPQNPIMSQAKHRASCNAVMLAPAVKHTYESTLEKKRLFCWTIGHGVSTPQHQASSQPRTMGRSNKNADDTKENSMSSLPISKATNRLAFCCPHLVHRAETTRSDNLQLLKIARKSSTRLHPTPQPSTAVADPTDTVARRHIDATANIRNRGHQRMTSSVARHPQPRPRQAIAVGSCRYEGGNVAGARLRQVLEVMVLAGATTCSRDRHETLRTRAPKEAVEWFVYERQRHCVLRRRTGAEEHRGLFFAALIRVFSIWEAQAKTPTTWATCDCAVGLPNHVSLLETQTNRETNKNMANTAPT